MKLTEQHLLSGDAWPSYFPPYNTPQGWEAEKLQAEIKIREDLNVKLNEHLFTTLGTMEFFKIFDRINENLGSIYRANEELYAICRAAAGLKEGKEVFFHEQV